MPEPRRKDEEKARERPEGLTPAEETGLPPEEYTGYRQVDPEDATEDSEAATREADLQPGTPKSERGEREKEREGEG